MRESSFNGMSEHLSSRHEARAHHTKSESGAAEPAPLSPCGRGAGLAVTVAFPA